MVQQQQQQQQPSAQLANGTHLLNQAIHVEGTSLAMPAIIANQQAQYSPQASLYQQQLIKGAKQLVPQQQHQAGARLNGVNGSTNGIPQHSPQSQQQQQQHKFSSQQNSPQQQVTQVNQFSQIHMGESLYTSSQQAGRPGSLYAPKPTFYGQLGLETQSGQLYQAARQQPITLGAPTYFQAQQSPSSQALVLSARQQPQQQQQQHQQQPQQRPVSPLNVLHVQNVANQQAANLSALQQQQLEQQLEQQQQQQQRQMQQLVMSYQEQREQMQLQQQQQTAYLPSQPQAGHHQLQQERRLVGAPLGQRPLEPAFLNHHSYWPNAIQADASQQHQRNSQAELMSQQQQQQQRFQVNQNRGQPYLRANAGKASSRLSDRDSVSTLSRFNQLDERRSFTMRSQFTSQTACNKSNKQFNFLELTGEALKSVLGLAGGRGSGASQRQPLLANSQEPQSSANGANQSEQMRRNMSLAMAGEPRKQHQQLGQVTIIDSGEDYYFKRQVFRYQLVIMRLLNLLLSALVLLSPVAMLLVPKMEPFIRAGQQEQTSGGLEYGAHSDSAGASAGSPGPVTHALGLVPPNKQLAALGKQQHLALAAHSQQQQPQQQPQWRISECQSSDCDGPLIGFVIRLLLLALAHWALFFRAQTASLPRVDFQRCLLVSLALLVTLAYWLFFVFRVFDKRYNDYELHYMTIVQFSISMLETLLVLHYFALALVELRQRKKVYCLKVVRSPDGASKYYTCGALSVQKCAQFVLDKYHRHFATFDSAAEQLLALEDELARQLDKQRKQRQHDSSSSGANQQQQQAARRRRSRPNSPLESNENNDGDEEDEPNEEANESNNELDDLDERRSSRRRGHRRNQRAHHRRRRHHSSSASRRANKNDDDQDEDDDDDDDDDDNDNEEEEVDDDDVDVDVDDNNDEEEEEAGGKNEQERGKEFAPKRPAASRTAPTTSKRQRQDKANSKADEPAKTNEGAVQSNDALASRLKNSSLEPGVRIGDGLERAGGQNDLEISERPRHSRATGRSARHQGARDDAESVRSARSRRSTSSRVQRERQSHSASGRRHREHRERSASRSGNEPNELEASRRRASCEQPNERDNLEEHERKLRRRKLRLLAAVESSFERVRRLEEGTDSSLKANNEQAIGLGQAAAVNLRPAAGGAMDAAQAARSLYPQIARSLQKYLRLTKQTGRHNLQSIYEHLSKCLLYKLSARTFLEKFTNFEQVWQQNETNLFANCRLINSSGLARSGRPLDELELNSWSLVCDTLLSRQIESGTFFLLKQGQVSLLVTVARLPHLNLSEQMSSPHGGQFSLASHPETSSV